MISHTRQGAIIHEASGSFLLRALGSASCHITYETGGTTCYGYWNLRRVIPHTRQRGRFLTGIRFYVVGIIYETRATICYGHWVLRLVISFTRQEERFVTDIGFCVLRYHSRDRGYELLRALCSASRDIIYKTGSTI